MWNQYGESKLHNRHVQTLGHGGIGSTPEAEGCVCRGVVNSGDFLGDFHGAWNVMYNGKCHVGTLWAVHSYWVDIL